MPHKRQPELPITDRQRDVLDFIRAFTAEHGWAPTVREVGQHFNLSVNSIHLHITALAAKGYVKRGRGARAIKILDREATP